MKQLSIGQKVFGPTKQHSYRIVGDLGEGGFGRVFEVQDTQGNRYALKTVRGSLDSEEIKALLNEGQFAVQIDHPNVIRTIFFHNGKLYPNLPPYLIIEFADGGTLEAIIEVRRKTQNYFSNDELRTIFLKLAKGMQAIHEKLLHRDIKPNNILSVGGQWKIADFGLSKIVDAVTRSPSVTLKRFKYLKCTAPEVWDTGKHSTKSDMYAMGLTFFEIATLESAYDPTPGIDQNQAWRLAHLTQQPKDPRLLNPGLDLNLVQLILKMIEKDPNDRYASWDNVISRLEAVNIEPASSKGGHIDSLVELAFKSKRRVEQGKLEVQERERTTKEYQGLIEVSFRKITNAVTEIVEDFNSQSDYHKLAMANSYPLNTWSLGFIIYAEGPGRLADEIRVWLSPVYGEHKLHDQEVKAWGFIVAPSGHGFNIILVSRGPDDLYGEWTTLRATINPKLIDHKIDKRPPPFPFELHELPMQVARLNGQDRFGTEQREFTPDLLIPLLKELFT
jgi:eukaryotic-like serine/threonine-protein kinase